MNILVTGAFGQLGSWMRILSVGSSDSYVFADVAGPGEGQPEMLRRLGGPEVPTGCVSLDITDAEAVRAAVVKHKTDVIVNCAAFTNVDAAEDREELAEALRTNSDSGSSFRTASFSSRANAPRLRGCGNACPGSVSDPNRNAG